MRNGSTLVLPRRSRTVSVTLRGIFWSNSLRSQWHANSGTSLPEVDARWFLKKGVGFLVVRHGVSCGFVDGRASRNLARTECHGRLKIIRTWSCPELLPFKLNWKHGSPNNPIGHRIPLKSSKNRIDQKAEWKQLIRGIERHEGTCWEPWSWGWSGVPAKRREVRS